MQAVYVANEDCLADLLAELANVSLVSGNLVFAPYQEKICFADDIWFSPTIVSFQSISEAARILRKEHRFWFLNPVSHVRRSRLIEEQLRKLPTLTRNFPITDPLPSIGCFSLLDQNTLVYAVQRLKSPPLGRYEFIEDKENPPSRAYLKLWEALTVLGRYPRPSDSVIDLGASPGGWTYVMQSFGAKITAVDKAPLDPRIATLPGVTTFQASAFSLDPKSLKEPVDWLLSDVACYPERLYQMLMGWLSTKNAKQIIFTIKLQGKTDHEMLRRFKNIEGSTVLHLLNNKHEVTFFYPGLSA